LKQPEAIQNRSNRVAVTPSKLLLALITCLFIIIFASRVLRLSTAEMVRDEISSIWQTFGTPSQIMIWTPQDAPPGYYFLVGVWRILVGLHPVSIRLLPVFAFMITSALLYRVTAELVGTIAALIAIAVCAAINYVIVLGIGMRYYGVEIMLILLAWWLMLRFFRRPTMFRAVWLGVCLAAMFYIHVTTIFAMLFLGGYSLIVYGWSIRYWWKPLLITVPLSIPVILALKNTASNQFQVGSNLLFTKGQVLLNRSFLEQWNIMISDYVGADLVLWLVLLIIATAVIIKHYGLQRRVLGILLWMLAIILLVPSAIFFAYQSRQVAWVLPGFALWIGWGFSRLPRSVIAAVLAICIVLMFGDASYATNGQVSGPLVATFSWLSQHVQTGDAVLVDPRFTTIHGEEWDYFTRAYFPNGLKYVSEPSSVRRLWYIYGEGQQDQTVLHKVEDHTILDDQFDAQYENSKFRVRLYEAPPDINGVAFANGMHFYGLESVPPNVTSPIPVWSRAETIHLRLWWSADGAIPNDYSLALYVNDSKGTRVLQVDGPPQPIDGPNQTSQWITGRYYLDEKYIELPTNLPGLTDYTVFMTVYQSWDNQRISAPGETSDKLLKILQFHVRGFG